MSTAYLRAAAAALTAGAVLFAGAAAQAATAGPDEVQIFEAAAQPPPLDHTLGRVRVRECRPDNADARSAALARLQRKALAMGANAVVQVQLTVGESQIRASKTGLPNPCRFETDAEGSAAVLAAGQAAASPARGVALAAAPK